MLPLPVGREASLGVAAPRWARVTPAKRGRGGQAVAAGGSFAWCLSNGVIQAQRRVMCAVSRRFVGTEDAPVPVLLPGGEAAFHGFVPHGFAWSLYLPGLLLMAMALWRTGRQQQSSPDKRGISS